MANIHPEPKQLANLLAVAQHSSITRAAASRGISQPALSNSLVLLEKRLGVKLIERGRQGSKLTEFGELVARQARALDSLLSHTVEEVRLKLLGSDGLLKIGATPIAAASLVPDALSKLIQMTPHMAITVIEGADDYLMNELLTGRIELSVGPVMVDRAPPAIEEETLAYDPLTVVVGKRNALSKRRSISLTELRHAQWILPDEGSAYRRQVEAIFVTAGVPWPEHSICTNSLAVIEASLMQTDTVAILSKLLVSRRSKKHLVCISLKEAGKARAIGIKRIRESEPSANATRLIKQLRAVAPKLLSS